MSQSNTSFAVDNTDWLKAFAIVMFTIDHTGYFFVDDAQWWNALGRLAAPVFFFLLGYAGSRKFPLNWLWLGCTLTLLDSWNTDWDWVALNILFSLALIRFARPMILSLLQRFGWFTFVAFLAVSVMLLHTAGELFDYGAEGWLWALFGLCQRMYINAASTTLTDERQTVTGSVSSSVSPGWGKMRLTSCLVAVTVYIWQEQIEFEFSNLQLVVVAFSVSLLSIGLSLFARGPSRFQPPGSTTGVLHFLGRHTLEIYAIQLACFELIINVFPDLAA